MTEKERTQQEEFLVISQRTPRTYWQIVRRQFMRNKLAVAGLWVVILLFFVAIYAPFLAYDKPFLLRIYPRSEYQQSWEGLYGLYSDLNRKLTEVRQKHQQVERVRKLRKDYEQTKANQITVGDICERLRQGEEEEKLRTEIPQKRAEPFRLTDQDVEDLEDAGASEEFIDFLRRTGTKFDTLSLTDLFELLEKKTPLEQIREEVKKKRINPFFFDFDTEDELREKFAAAYRDKFKSSLALEEAFNSFLNFLTTYKLDLSQKLKQLEAVSLEKLLKEANIPFDEYKKLFLSRSGELQGYLLPEKRALVEKAEREYALLLGQLAEGKVPSEKDFERLHQTLKALQLGVGMSHTQLVMTSFYPIVYQLSGFDIFFMVLFALAFLAPLPFRWIDSWRMDAFGKFFVKGAFLFTIPAACAAVWWYSVPVKEDRNDYRAIVRNLVEGEYAYIQPFFYSPYWMNDEESFLPPSWVMPDYVGFESRADRGKTGKVVYEAFEVPPKVSSDLPIGMQIRSSFLRPWQDKYGAMRKALAEEIEKRLARFIQKHNLRPFLAEDLTVDGRIRDSRNIRDTLKEVFRVPQGQVEKVLASIREYERLYVQHKKDILAAPQFAQWRQLEKRLSSIVVATDLSKYKKVMRYEIPEDAIVFLNISTKRLSLKRSVRLMPGATLILPAQLEVSFDYYPPGFYWTDENPKNLYNYHIFGTDKLGRDIFSRMVWGARISLTVGFVAVSIYVLIGIILGALAGYFGGIVDLVISRFIEVMICFPTLVLILTLIAVLPRSITQIWNGMFAIMVVIGITGWTGVARLIRGEFLKLRNQDFVIAGRALGVSNFRLIFRHIVPNALAPVLVSATFGIASAILTESGLSFLGIGISPPTPTWGEMLSKAQGQPLELWWLTVFPGMAIFLTVTVYNLVGEGIRDAIDPRLKER